MAHGLILKSGEFVTDHECGLYCDHWCATDDNASPEQLEVYTREKLLAAIDDDRLWYDDDCLGGSGNRRMPQFGHTCNADDCGAILWE